VYPELDHALKQYWSGVNACQQQSPGTEDKLWNHSLVVYDKMTLSSGGDGIPFSLSHGLFSYSISLVMIRQRLLASVCDLLILQKSIERFSTHA
jgi:hypothetical protein